MRKRKPGYGILLGLTVAITLCALATIMPWPGAGGECMLGYKAFCTFAPFSTVLCLIPAGIVCIFRKRFFTEPA